jgi:ABC-type oligopeptide transport system substrate-binding subunit
MHKTLGAAILATGLAVSATAEAQTLNVMRAVDPPHYDAQRTTHVLAADVVNMIQDTLVALDWDGRTPIPYLARSWDISPDARDVQESRAGEVREDGHQDGPGGFQPDGRDDVGNALVKSN